MSLRRRRIPAVLAIGISLAMLSSGFGSAKQPAPPWQGEPKDLSIERRAVPEDRYAMAGGCYILKATDGGYVVRDGDGFAASGVSPAAAEAFRFQATDLGRYLLYGTERDFVAASEGLLGEAVRGANDHHLVGTAGGLALSKNDELADAAARSEANKASGRGDGVVSAPEPSNLADWEVDQAGTGTFTFTLPETNQALVVRDGALDLAADGPTAFAPELATGCPTYPEIEVNVDGPVVGGRSPIQEVRGYFDGHLHMMAFEFLGGRARCGRPWHRFGAPYALVDCPDHEPGGHGAVLEGFLSGTAGSGHDTDGWPTFEGWPRYNSLTHEQVYYKWLERSWRGGLRMFTNLLVDNNELCKIYPYKKNSCNEMDGVRLQHKRIYQLQDYIDAQNGGPGEGWFRIVDDPFEAREVINSGKLAVVLGIEVSVPLDCGEILEVPLCDQQQMAERLDEVWRMGVRQMELVNKFDNAFSGVAGDAGATGVLVNNGNKLDTGHYWKMDTCEEDDGHAPHAHDKTQYNFHDESGAPDQFSGRDALAGAIFAASGTSGAVPVYPEGPHCNQIGLTDLGESMIREMVRRGIIFDPDHMSAAAQAEAMDLVESLGYSGLISSHGWSNDTIYPRIYDMGGFITPYAGRSESFASEWDKHRNWIDDRFYFGFGYGADTNGFGSQGGPRSNAPNPVRYPISGFGGTTVHQQRSGTRTYDINSDGVAHYGLYPDWIEDLRMLRGSQIVEDMQRGPEAYLQMWERALGIPGDACRSDVPDLARSKVASLQKGMSVEQVLRLLGQPAVRDVNEYRFCVEGGRAATVRFTPDGKVNNWSDHAVPKGI